MVTIIVHENGKAKVVRGGLGREFPDFGTRGSTGLAALCFHSCKSVNPLVQ